VIGFRARVWRQATRKAKLDGLRIHDLLHTAVALWPERVAALASQVRIRFRAVA
jgi:inosine-uridine nucleoside N-ribohydrolase